VTPGTIKTATYPFGSAELYLFMSMGLGSTFITSIALLGRPQAVGTYLAGHLAMAYWIFPRPVLLALVLFALFGLVPLLLTSILIGFSKR
jgi:hypothetical protein